MGDAEEAVKALDVKIAETEQELERLRQLLAELESNLRVLRRARVLLVGDNPQADEAQPVPLERVQDEGVRRESRTGEMSSPTGRAAVDSVSGPINTVILDIMREAGKPLHVNELVERLRARGKDTDPATATDAIAHLVKTGKLWRTAPKTYGLPKGVSF